MQPSWISVDFDNWRDWENEEDEGKVEYDQYVDVSIPELDLLIRSVMYYSTLQYLLEQYSCHCKASFCVFICLLYLYPTLPDPLFR